MNVELVQNNHRLYTKFPLQACSKEAMSRYGRLLCEQNKKYVYMVLPLINIVVPVDQNVIRNEIRNFPCFSLKTE